MCLLSYHFLRICIRDLPVSEEVMEGLSALGWQSEGYSGADIHIACREASMMPMRRLLSLMDPTEMHALRKAGQLIIPKVLSVFSIYYFYCVLYCVCSLSSHLVCI